MAEKLALEGGRPVRPTNLPYGRQWVSDEDVATVVETLRGDWLTQGPMVERFESELARVGGARFAVAFSNGTAALHAVADACGLSAATELVTSAVTFLADANCAAYVGAVPRLADIDPASWNVTAASLERSSSPATRVWLPVHLAGNPCELEPIARAASARGLRVVEDACHALGATYQDRPIGCCDWSDMTVYSFHPVKHVTTAEGGAVLTNDEELLRRLRTFRNHGMERDASRFLRSERGPWIYEMQSLGYNYRLPDLNCALGLSQLKRLPQLVERRRRIAALYRELLPRLEGVGLPQPDRLDAGTVGAYHLFVVRVDMSALDTDKKTLFEAMRAENIGVQVHYIPLQLQPYYQHRYGWRDNDCPNALDYYHECMSLPMFPAMSDADVDDAVRALAKVLGRYRKLHGRRPA